MATLSLELFTRSFDDMERRQYEIYSAIAEYTARFRRNRLYPELQELIALYRSLEQILAEHEQLHSRETIRVLPPAASTHAEPEIPAQPLEQMFELIRWAIPVLAAAIEEGTALFDFVEDNITLTSVGLVPMYTSEGYVLVPEHRACTLHVLRYATSQLVEYGDSYRMLRTVEVLTLSHRGVWSAAETVKHWLIEEYPELPNPATFSCETDLDFPYTETILPVVKRKLMCMLSS
ncbi:MAG: hypothetical protein N2663_05490 [Chlorobi bacterium]|nr:hypothetical protein [Chlorobiota bacterium]